MEQSYKVEYSLLFYFQRDQTSGAIDTVIFFNITRFFKMKNS